MNKCNVNHFNEQKKEKIYIAGHIVEPTFSHLALTLTVGVSHQPHTAGAVTEEAHRHVHTQVRAAAVVYTALILICKGTKGHVKVQRKEGRKAYFG